MPILKEPETKQPTNPVAADPAKLPEKPLEDWDNLRGLSKSVQKHRQSGNVRTALFALLFILTFLFVGWFFHDHLPALVSFGAQLKEAASTFVSNDPTPSSAQRESTAPYASRSRASGSSSRIRAAQRGMPDNGSKPDEAFDPLARPFYATAVIGDRKIALIPNNRIIVLDVAKGTWTIVSESE